MKKLSILVIVSLVFLFVTTPVLNADSMKIFANFGVVTDDSFTFDYYLWNLGANIDLGINDLFMISPELNVWSYEFKFSTFLLEPAVLANVKLGTFFAGAGLTKLFLVTGTDTADISEFALKLNAGFRGQNIKFRVFLITPFDDILGSNILGVQIGLGF